MEAVRGLGASRCVSAGVSAASTSEEPSGSLLSRRGTGIARTAAGARARRGSRNCRRLVLVAVLADAQVQVQVRAQGAGASGKTSLGDPQAAVSVSVLLPELDLGSTVANGATAASKRTVAPALLGLTDTALESTLEHRAWTSLFATTAAATLAKAVSACGSEADAAQVAAGVLAGWALSDLATGIYHWGIDNYGSASTPIVGSQIDAFQGHHRRPWTITKRAFANNVHAIARPASAVLAPCLLLPGAAFADAFLAVFMAMVVLSQHFHALAHMKKSQLPPWVAALQDRGLILGRKMHGTHHRPPYDVNYCIVSGLWNRALTDADVFKRLEGAVFARFGVAPRAWGETHHEWLQADTYFEDGSEFDPSP